MTAKVMTPLDRRLRPGHFLFWQGQSYRVLSGDPADPLILHLEQLPSLTRHQANLIDLLLPATAEAEPLFAPTQAALQQQVERRYPPPALIHPPALPTNLRQKAETIITVVEAVEHFINIARQQAIQRQDKFRLTPALRQACAQLTEPVHLATYYNYRRLYRQYEGQPARIAAALRRSSFNQLRFNPIQVHCVDTHILRFYARSPSLRPRPLTLYRLLQSTLQRTGQRWLDPARGGAEPSQQLIAELLDPNIPMTALLANPEKAALLASIDLPSRSWFYQYLRWFEHQPEQGKSVMIARYGQAAWEQEHLVFDTFVTRATLPLQYVFADHWLVDVFTVDETTRQQVRRLWLTLLIDAYSRSILGLALLDEAPCSESIQSALRHAIWPKTLPTNLGVTGGWSCYGLPQQLFLDNAWAHHGYSLEHLAQAISQAGHYSSIDLVFRPPYKSRYGALIERLFGNLSSQIKERLPGAIRSSQPEALRQAAHQASLLAHDLERIIYQLIVIYQHTPHQELAGLTPEQKWAEGLQLGLPLVPPLTPAIERLFWRANPTPRLISGKGIAAFGLHYWSPDLSGLPRLGWDGQPIAYHFSYEPADISRLALFQQGQWVGDVYAKELRLPDGRTAALSLWERQLALRLARTAGQSPRDWLAYIRDIEELTRRRLAEKKQVRRTASKVAAGRPVDLPAVEAALSQTPADPVYTDLLTAFVASPGPEVKR